MKKLVIHPKDSSTEFLSGIYRDLSDVTLVTGGISKHDVRDMVVEHDQVIMLGHGTPAGLMSCGQFDDSYGNIVDASFVPALSAKNNSVFIWCNSDMFVDRFRLKGFFSGMFISEVGEAYMMGLGCTPKSEVDESNSWFANAVGRAVDCEPELLHSYVKNDYGELTYRNPVARYNHDRLYVNA